MKTRSKFGWLELLSGLGMIALGIAAIAAPKKDLTYLYAAVALITGINDILFYVKAGEYSGLRPIVSLICGMLSIMVGAVLLAYPNSGMEIRYSLVFPIWYGSHCLFRLVNLKVHHQVAGSFNFWFSMILSILGLFTVANMLLCPEVLNMKMNVLSGVYLIASGIDCISIAVSKLGGKW